MPPHGRDRFQSTLMMQEAECNLLLQRMEPQQRMMDNLASPHVRSLAVAVTAFIFNCGLAGGEWLDKSISQSTSKVTLWICCQSPTVEERGLRGESERDTTRHHPRDKRMCLKTDGNTMSRKLYINCPPFLMPQHDDIYLAGSQTSAVDN